MRSIVVMFGVSVLASTAHAEDPPPPPTATAPTLETGERATMPAKRGMIHADLGINLSADTVGDPVSISPDLWYGVNDKLTVGLVHSFSAATGIMGVPFTSICIGDACPSVYDFVGADLRYGMKTGAVTVAAVGGLYALQTDPLQIALKLGAIIHWRAKPGSKLAVDVTPNLFLGFTKRDGEVDPVSMEVVADPNKETLVVPATLWYSANPKLAVGLQVGLFLPVEDAGDAYSISTALGANYRVDKQLSLDAAFALPFVAAGGGQTGFDARTFTIGGGYAF